jgi:hypothetical protein
MKKALLFVSLLAGLGLGHLLRHLPVHRIPPTSPVVYTFILIHCHGASRTGILRCGKHSDT